jgi:murein L,D-transpeptidase YafK
MALHISYPDAAHTERASKLGVSPGGDIMIHGLPPGYAESLGAAHAQYNWTEGCIAVTDREIEEIWAAVPQGAPIQIKP